MKTRCEDAALLMLHIRGRHPPLPRHCIITSLSLRIGTVSFVLLCLQYSRDQRNNLGIPLFTERVQREHGRMCHRALL